MSEMVTAALADSVPPSKEKPPSRKRGKKLVGLTGGSRKTTSVSLSKLIIDALSISQERTGMSLAALKKALAAVGYDVEKNNSRIKLGLKSLVSKGILVQTRGTGACGSFKLSKKVAAEPTKEKVKKPSSTKTKKRVLARDSKSPQKAKTNKRAKTPRTALAEKAGRTGRKAKGAKGKQQRESPAKARAGKPKAGNSKLTQQKTNPRKAITKK
ncbi:histone H1t [Physeter macrocephalus]|uniref:Histone H1t n=1 Tax=Physeter macrocephalus TaxID=9755 RepID=A0A455AHW3_PHYMC|nr:histone H1t [Physeter catodon]|eukprot:XP_028335219.1 histone H1t [Physeter catodon]